MITSMAVSRDGRYLAACGADLNVPIGSDVTVWDLSTRRPVQQIAANAHCVAFAADGETLLTGHRSPQLLRWSVANGKEMPPLEMLEKDIPDHSYPRVRAVQCSADGKWVAATDGSTIYIASLETAAPIMLEELDGVGIQGLAFSPDSDILLAAGSDGRLWRWRTSTGSLINVPFEGDSPLSAVAYAPSGKVLAAGGVDGSVMVWEADSGARVTTLPPRGGAVTALTFVDDERVALSKNDKTVTVWTWATAQQPIDEDAELRVRKGHAASVTSVAFVPNRNLLISAGKDRQIKLWDASRTEERRRLQVASLDWGLQLIDVSPDSRTLSVASVQDWQFWALPSLVEMPQIADSAWSVRYSPDGLLIATTHYEPRFIVKIWDASVGELLCRLPGSNFAPYFSPDGKMLVTGYEKIDLWDIANSRDPRPIGTLGDHGYKCEAGFFQKTNRIFAGGATQNALSIWDATSQERLALLETGHPVRCAVVSPDEKLIAIGTMDAAIGLWDLLNYKQVATLKGHGDAVYSLDFTPDGKTLASGSLDGTVKLWNMATRSLLFTLDDHQSPVVAVKFSPDRQYLLTGSQDGTIFVRPAAR
jgi:WD40 repeat protein